MKDNSSFKGEVKINNFLVKYYVTGSDKPNHSSGYFEWGIRADKYEKGNITESEEIKNISPDFERVSEIAEILKRNAVTPSGLLYAVSDLITLTVR